MKKILTGPITRADILSILALIVSASSVILAFYQYFLNQTEELSIIINSHVNQGPIKITDLSDIDGKDKVIQVPLQLIISNTGTRKVSIIKYNIHNVQSAKLKQYDYKHGIYYGVDGGIFKPNGEKIELPLTIGSSESRIFNVYVGILIDPNIYKIIDQRFQNQPFSMKDAIKIIGTKGMDIFGNKADLYEINDEEFYLSVDSANKKLPLFMFEFISGRNKKFGTVASADFD